MTVAERGKMTAALCMLIAVFMTTCERKESIYIGIDVDAECIVQMQLIQGRCAESVDHQR
jgi:hypothetical protein